MLVHVDSVVDAKKAQSDASIRGNRQIIELCEELRVRNPFGAFEYRLAEKNLGVWANKKSCVTEAFERSDDVLVIEDDIVVSRDAILFCEWARAAGLMALKGVFQLSLFSYFFPAGLGDKQAMLDKVETSSMARAIYVRNWATPWGWYLPRRSWELIEREWNGWDQWVGHKVRELDMVEVAPVVSHCNNVGVEGVNRRGREAVDSHLRAITSNDLTTDENWSPVTIDLSEFLASLGSDLGLAREHANRTYQRFAIASASGSEQKIPAVPSMDPAGLSRFKECLERSQVFLEYGAGGSTLLAGRMNVSTIVSVESDAEFMAKVRESFLMQDSRSRLISQPANIGATGKWGHPADRSSAALWPCYCSEVWEKMSSLNVTPDLILIDGRFRLACFAVAMLLAVPGTTILFDDYETRDYYHDAGQLVPPTAIHGRMAEFKVVEAFDRAGMLRLLLKHVTNPL